MSDLTNIFGEEKFSWQPSKIEVADGKKKLKTQRENYSKICVPLKMQNVLSE
jgi:hypothetical protein